MCMLDFLLVGISLLVPIVFHTKQIAKFNHIVGYMLCILLLMPTLHLTISFLTFEILHCYSWESFCLSP